MSRFRGQLPLLPCSSCGEQTRKFSKKQRQWFRKGSTDIVCQPCVHKDLHPLIECSACGQFSRNFSKGHYRQFRRGNSENLVCEPCQKARLEEDARQRKEMWERRFQEIRQRSKEELERRLANPNPPARFCKPFPRTHRTPDATLQVTKGGICFGIHNDCDKAASQPLQTRQEAFDKISRRDSPPINNVPARNGAWHQYRIVGPGVNNTLADWAWIVCHEDVDPLMECRYLLYHSLQRDHGGGAAGFEQGVSHVQNLDKFGILKINRYGWGRWQVSDVANDWDDSDTSALYKEGFQVTSYGTTSSVKHMHCYSDFMYGRIRFENEAARSILLYSAYTEFQRCCLACMYATKGEPHPSCLLGSKDWSWNEKLPPQRKLTDYFAVSKK